MNTIYGHMSWRSFLDHIFVGTKMIIVGAKPIKKDYFYDLIEDIIAGKSLPQSFKKIILIPKPLTYILLRFMGEGNLDNWEKLIRLPLMGDREFFLQEFVYFALLVGSRVSSPREIIEFLEKIPYMNKADKHWKISLPQKPDFIKFIPPWIFPLDKIQKISPVMEYLSINIRGESKFFAHARRFYESLLEKDDIGENFQITNPEDALVADLFIPYNRLAFTLGNSR